MGPPRDKHMGHSRGVCPIEQSVFWVANSLIICPKGSSPIFYCWRWQGFLEQLPKDREAIPVAPFLVR